MAARVVGMRQEGVIPCRMVPSMKGRGTRQLHDVTGKVQHARLIVAVQSARCASCCAGTAHLNLKMNDFGRRKSKPRFRVNRISRGRGKKNQKKKPLFSRAQDIPLVKGMG